MPPGRLRRCPGASGESWGSASSLLRSWLSCAPAPYLVSAPEGCSPGPGLPCPLMPTPPPPAARLPRGSSAQGARGAGTNGPPSPLTPPRAPRAFSLSRQRRALIMRSWQPLLRVFLFPRGVCFPVDALSPGVLVWGALRGIAPSPSILFTSASLLITMTTTQLVVNKCQLTHG